MSYRLIVGLGNPGQEYEKTRHNVGFRVIEAFAAKLGAGEWKKERSFKSQLAQLVLESGEKLILLKPQDYMNNSGVCIQKVCSYYKIPPVGVIVIYDEINLNTAELKLSLRGSAGGHNGVDDILKRLHPVFTRLRVGIGPKTIKEMDLAEFVLGNFRDEEETLIKSSMPTYVECLERLLEDGAEKTMIYINRRTKNNDRNENQL